MAIREKDFLKRIIEQAAEALARIAGLRRRRAFDEALQALDDSAGELLGIPKTLLDAVDVPTAARLVRDPPRLRVYARLLAEEADILVEAGRDPGGRVLRARLLLEEAGRAEALPPDDAALLARLSS